MLGKKVDRRGNKICKYQHVFQLQSAWLSGNLHTFAAIQAIKLNYHVYGEKQHVRLQTETNKRGNESNVYAKLKMLFTFNITILQYVLENIKIKDNFS